MDVITKIALELSKNQANFSAGGSTYSKEEANDALRKAFFEEIGVESIDNIYDYRANKYKIFKVLSEKLTPVINERIEDIMGQFADVRTVGWGETIEFEVPNPELFKVSRTAMGTANLVRQRIDNGRLKMTTDNFSIKIYDELYRFLSGKVDWAGMLDKVAKSYEQKIANRVNELLFGSYNNLENDFKYSGSFNEDELLEILARIETLYGSAILVGSKAALSKVKPEYVGDADKSARNKQGYIAEFMGYRCVELKNAFKTGTHDFVLDPNQLLILPSNEDKFVKIVLEGDAIINDFENSQGDQSIEHSFIQRVGIAMSLTDKYGIVRFV